ncbi:MAG TPA: gluconate 2-dehydrogenase subunit 3 family protein [Myxococcota bacterium]|nr:gluconate 2-dehydrogenase subunit 3 family protein [Myxococcota bacterium]
MRNLKLPKVPRDWLAPDAGPGQGTGAETCQPAPQNSERGLSAALPRHLLRAAHLTRRQFLFVSGAVAAVASATRPRVARAFSFWRQERFFTDAEFSTLEALVDRILPPDRDPGAKELGVAVYIERLLMTFDCGGVGLYRRGPYSGRTPYPDYRLGTPSSRFPENGFLRSIRPSRLQELYWRAELYGSQAAGIPAELDAAQGGPLIGLRDLYPQGLASVDSVAIATAGQPFAQLSVADQDRVLAQLDSPGVLPIDPRRGNNTFLDIVIQHVLEGSFSAPEYGGNRNTQGWQMLGIEGDNQPLGYSIFSFELGTYRERPEHPMSTPNPDELAPDGSVVPIPLTPDGLAIQQGITQTTRFLELDNPGACNKT